MVLTTFLGAPRKIKKVQDHCHLEIRERGENDQVKWKKVVKEVKNISKIGHIPTLVGELNEKASKQMKEGERESIRKKKIAPYKRRARVSNKKDLHV